MNLATIPGPRPLPFLGNLLNVRPSHSNYQTQLRDMYGGGTKDNSYVITVALAHALLA